MRFPRVALDRINELTGESPKTVSPCALDVAASVLDDSFTLDLGHAPCNEVVPVLAGCEKTHDSSYPLPDPDDRRLQRIPTGRRFATTISACR